MMGPVGMRCPILVGRDAELSALRAHLAGALAGRGGFVLVRGEAGLGKSRLCRELIEGGPRPERSTSDSPSQSRPLIGSGRNP